MMTVRRRPRGRRRAMPRLASLLRPSEAAGAKGCDWIAFGILKIESDELETILTDDKLKRS